MSHVERRGLVLVALAVTLFSTTPVLILWAEPVDPVVKTWARMTVAAVAVGLAARFSGKQRPPLDGSRGSKRDVVRFLGYGLIAALHFLFYVSSLSFTTAAHSLSIVYTAPIFVTLFSARLLKELLRPRQWFGIVLSVAGIGIVAGLEPTFSERVAFGDLLALLSAITFGLYSVAGRYERDRFPLLVYAGRVYGAAALWLLPAALLGMPNSPPGAWGTRQVISVILLGLGPLALGHTLYNAALRRVHATSVNIVASQEVTGGILLSWLLLAQVPSANSLVGAAVTLLGTTLVLL